jgi:NTE family protein
MKKFFTQIQKLFRQRKKKKIGLVLGSGGLWGITHIGILKVLEENKIYPDYIVGCSMGSLIGAYYALNPDIKNAEEVIGDFGKWDLLKLLDIKFSRSSIISGKKIRYFIDKLFGNKTFSDTKIPLRIVATDLEKGEEVVFTKGKLADAVMASISIPGIFPPVELNGKILVDGAVTNPTPINIAKKMGAEIIVGVDLTMRQKVELKNPWIYQVIMRSYEILRNQSTRLNIHEGKNVIIIKPDSNNLSKIKLNEFDKFLKEGERIAKENIGKIKKVLRE